MGLGWWWKIWEAGKPRPYWIWRCRCLFDMRYGQRRKMSVRGSGYLFSGEMIFSFFFFFLPFRFKYYSNSFANSFPRPSRALNIKRKMSKILMMKISRPKSEGNWRAYSPTKTKNVNSSPCRWTCRVVRLRLFPKTPSRLCARHSER